MGRNTAVTNGLIVEFLQEIFEDIIDPYSGQEIPLFNGLVQCFRNIPFVAKGVQREQGNKKRNQVSTDIYITRRDTS